MGRRFLLLPLLAVLLFSAWGIAYGGVCQADSTMQKTRKSSDMKPTIFFDRTVYHPDVSVFWNRNASLLPIRISVVDRYIGSRFVKVKILSSVDKKDVILERTAPGRFEGSIRANCLRLGEVIPSNTFFNTRYGDIIVVKYLGHVQATALIAFPKYVEANTFNYIPYYLFDSEGVPLVNYGSPIGIQYNAVEICHYALSNYYMYLATESSTFRERFLVQANWLVRNVVNKGNFSIWEYEFDWAYFNCTAPWVSAMAQGEALSVLTRAYVLTRNMTYIYIAQTAMRSFEVEMNSGGVRYTDSTGVWYEEYADIGAPSGKVLNGFIFALFGLFEYSFETSNTEAFELFCEGTRTLSSNMYRYDTGSWSYYDLLHLDQAGLKYQQLHVRQLMTLYKITADQVFQEYSDRFSSYIK